VCHHSRQTVTLFVTVHSRVHSCTPGAGPDLRSLGRWRASRLTGLTRLGSSLSTLVQAFSEPVSSQSAPPVKNQSESHAETGRLLAGVSTGHCAPEEERMSAGGGMAGRYGITPGCGYMYGGCDTICHWWPCGSGWWYLQHIC
jgi:hypothetical protein